MSLDSDKNYTSSNQIYALIEADPTITYEHYVKSKVTWYKSIFGDAKYAVDSNNYPCVILPWLNGSYDGKFDLCVRFEQTSDSLLSKNANSSGTYISFGIYEEATKSLPEDSQFNILVEGDFGQHLLHRLTTRITKSTHMDLKKK